MDLGIVQEFERPAEAGLSFLAVQSREEPGLGTAREFPFEAIEPVADAF